MDCSASNFVFPLRPLATPRLRLEPLDPSKHAPLFFAGCKDHPHLFDFVTYGPFTSSAQYEEWCRTQVQEKPTSTAWAIYAKTQATPAKEKWEFAGIIGMINADVQNRSVELGVATVLPPFQGTFVINTVVGLCLLFALDPPPHGLGLRRVYRHNHSANEAATRTARRIGFALEGIKRFEKVVPEGKIGNSMARDGKAGPGGSRDTCLWAICSDEWDEKRQTVVSLMEQTDREPRRPDTRLKL